jgi:hypothetical protein
MLLSGLYNCRRQVFVIFAAAFLHGCGTLDSVSPAYPGQSEFIRVKSGQRICFDLQDPSEKCQWDFMCDDSDVEVRVDRKDSLGDISPRKVSVMIRIHRGYDGPSVVRFFCNKCNDPKTCSNKAFTISLFKRTGDVAFWE